MGEMGGRNGSQLFGFRVVSYDLSKNLKELGKTESKRGRLIPRMHALACIIGT